MAFHSSRALKPHTQPRDLISTFAFLVLFLVLGLVPQVQAKNLYQMTDSSEGDPGDGVLHPVPEIVLPDPSPSPHTVTMFFTMDSNGDYVYSQPLLIFPSEFYRDRQDSWGSSWLSPRSGYSILIPEGRSRNAR